MTFISNMQMFYLNSTQNCLPRSLNKICIITLYLATRNQSLAEIGNTESKSCSDLQSGVSFCYKIRAQMVPSKVEITLTLQVIRHLLLSHFRTKGLIPKFGLSSISLPSARHCAFSSLLNHLGLFLKFLYHLILETRS